MLGIKSNIYLLLKKIIWRKFNRHNSTVVSSSFKLSSVSVGNYTYGALNVVDSNPISKLRIGSFCSIAPNVTFILNSDHYINHLSSFPFKVKCLGDLEPEAISYGDIVIDDDVWIGFGCTVLSGVHIGQGAIIAAGAVVTKDVSPYAVVGGIPAKVLHYRFSIDVIDYLLSLDYSSLTRNVVEEHIEDLYKKLENVPLQNIKLMFSWFPKK